MLSKKKKPFKVFCKNSNRATVSNLAYEAIFGYNDIFIALDSDFNKINLANLRMYYIEYSTIVGMNIVYSYRLSKRGRKSRDCIS